MTGQERSPGVIDTVSPVRNDINNYNVHCKTNNSGYKEEGEEKGKTTQNKRTNVHKNDGDYNNNSLYDNNNNSGGTNKKETTAKTANELRNMPPLATAYCNPQIAKKLAVENLKHHALPDTVEDALYRSMQMKRDQGGIDWHPGGCLDVEPRAAAIGCKGYGAPGPTQCSKLKVYRPKTAGAIPVGDASAAVTERPKTSDPGRRKKDLSLMQLALCWDLKPPDPSDEPKRTPHVDGSNGSAAPAVFALVHRPESGKTLPQERVPSAESNGRVSRRPSRTAKSAWEDKGTESRRTRGANPSAVMDIVNHCDVQSEPVMGRSDNDRTPPVTKNTPSPPYSSGEARSQRPKSNGERQEFRNGNGYSGKLSKTTRHHQSTPNLSKNGSNGHENNNNNGNVKNKLLSNRPCMACERKVSSVQNSHEGSSKANHRTNSGNGSAINSLSSIRSDDNNNGSGKIGNNNIQAPKPRTPYAKRNYAIGTLAPPFSLWPGTTGQDYPEHWRLASVYQHSYKPIGSRRKTFLKSVYQ